MSAVTDVSVGGESASDVIVVTGTDVVAGGPTSSDVIVRAGAVTEVPTIEPEADVVPGDTITEVITTTVVTDVLATSATGPQGPRGLPGVSGGGAASYVHTQGVPAATWHIVHDLGFHPNVTVIDSGGSEAEGIVSYIDADTLDLIFTASFGGVAYLS